MKGGLNVAGLVVRTAARPIVEERGDESDPGARRRRRVGRARLRAGLLHRHPRAELRQVGGIVQAEAVARAAAATGIRGGLAVRGEAQHELPVRDAAGDVDVRRPGVPRIVEPVPDGRVDLRAVERIRDLGGLGSAGSGDGDQHDGGQHREHALLEAHRRLLHASHRVGFELSEKHTR